MSETTLTDANWTDTGTVDLAPFFERYDRRLRSLMGTALCISLLLSAVVATRLLTPGESFPKLGPVLWGMGVVYAPAFTLFWWGFTEFGARRRHREAAVGGRHPASPDDARNGMRVANAGFAFTVVLMVVGIIQQILMIPLAFGHPIGPPVGLVIPRVTTMAVGAVMIYLGNVWPRMPTPRAPTQKAAATMKINRRVGWFMVIFGLMVLLFGLFLPYVVPRARPTQPPFEASKHKEIPLPATALDRFVGRYDFGDNFKITVTHPGATLWVRREGIAGERGAPVYPEGPRAFFWKMVEAQLRFTTDASGKVTGAEFREAGPWQPGRRIAP